MCLVILQSVEASSSRTQKKVQNQCRKTRSHQLQQFAIFAMATKQPFKTTFDVSHVIRPIFTGGSIAIDTEAKILATTLGEDAVLTNPANGKHLAQVEGVRQSLKEFIPSFIVLTDSD